ncbi:MAG TPA: XRE family transcriptional regulator [Acidimicrobiales bacterium]
MLDDASIVSNAAGDATGGTGPGDGRGTGDGAARDTTDAADANESRGASTGDAADGIDAVAPRSGPAGAGGRDVPNTAADVVTTVGANVRRLREQAGLSLRELAARAAVSASTLSSLEAGSGNPGVQTLVHIAGALGVPFSELVTSHEPEVQVLRANEGVVVKAEGVDFANRLLVALSGRSVTEIYESTMEPDAVYEAEPHLAGVLETVVVTHGRLRVGPLGATVELGPGDRATFAGDRPHAYQALAPGTRLILVLSYR